MWEIKRERVWTGRGRRAWRFGLYRDGRLLAHYRTRRAAEAVRDTRWGMVAWVG